MKWIRGPPIGRGSSATVFAAHLDCGETVAVKSVELPRSTITPLCNNEQRIHSTIKSPYIIEYIGHEVTLEENGKLFHNIVMEYAPNGSLANLIRSSSPGNCLLDDDEARIRSYTRSILRGLEHLHSNGVAHCDVKPSNVLITGDGQPKIADLGCARRVGSLGSEKVSVAGTPMYMAPEVARGEEQGCPADVWALGCTVIEMATGRAPWSGVNDPVNAMYQIGFSGEVPKIPEFLSEQGKDFLGKCLDRDPKQRWSSSELLGHPFVEPEGVVVGSEGIFLCSGLKKSSSSPTSVLDQWKWMTEMDGLMSSVNEEAEGFSAAQDINCIINTTWHNADRRIRSLIEGGSGEHFPSWDLDDSEWITVRTSNLVEEDDDKDATDNAHPCSTCETIGVECSTSGIELHRNCLVNCYTPSRSNISCSSTGGLK